MTGWRALCGCFVLLGMANLARAEPALWVVQSKTAKIYLFGTMHILPKTADWFTPKIKAAFDQSDVLMEEADVGLTDAHTAQRIMAQAISPDVDLLRTLPASTADKFRKQVKACRLPDAVITHFKPWFASMLPSICSLMDSADHEITTANSSPETFLLKRAKESGKKLDFFETPEQQIGYLAGAPEAVQMAELKDAIEKNSDDPAGFGAMESSWLAGDTAAIAALVGQTKRESPAVYQTIFASRNERFAARITGMLQGTGTMFVAIGAGHLAGPDRVQAHLGTAAELVR